ncbi:hypothetical protein CTAYLR_007577 [Chrysophaeum taylorii]|uniref:Adenosine deaminase domain-containing protein n=1 Tax=Chrysophaeum taylorii TaxID=2483200 RepID=A0AAD7UE46_9STRA|nr:hypothetical protein CTAYLR_007577 [Chrysophaeum taylorii]
MVSLERIEALPKVELHAHLSGSVSQEFLAARSPEFRPVDVVGPRSLGKCFEYFRAVSRVIVDLPGLAASTRHVVSAFAAEECVYLELRTTPKRLGAATEVEYVETVRRVAAEFELDVKLLLSLDRGTVGSLEEALARVKRLADLATAFPDFVVGIDVCGDPRVKTLVPYVLPALEHLSPRLPLTIHTGEIRDDEEVRAILNADIDLRRLGHACFLPEDIMIDERRNFTIELCPTSNLVAMNLADLTDHHFTDVRHLPVRLSVNTDDRGLFNCSLSSELHDLAVAFDLSWDDLVDLQRQAIRAAFHPDTDSLLAAFESKLAALDDDE